MTLTLKGVGGTFFSAELSGNAETLRDALDKARAHIADKVSRSCRYLRGYRAADREFSRNKAILDGIVYRIIRIRQAAENKHGGFLDMLIDIRGDDKTNSLSDLQLRMKL